MGLRLLLVFATLLAAGQAQSVKIYSEFQRIDPFGAVVAADRAERPREILSPALARNAYATFQAVVTVPEGQQYGLFIAQNPDDAVRPTAYKPVYVKRGEAWIPDALEPLTISDAGQVAAFAHQVPGQTVTVVWIDMWVAPNATVRRTRFEVQLNVGEQWIIYPMELRIISPMIPASSGALEPLAPLEASAAGTAAAPLRAYACAIEETSEEGPLTIRRLIRRNARQDMALARSLGRPALATEILTALGAADRTKWCEAPSGPPQLGAEWYLRVRDYLYGTAIKPPQ